MRIFALGIAIGSALVTAGSAMAHHSFAAEFDANMPVTIQGHVTRVAWTNPHVWVYLNVTDDAGNITNWGFEMGAPHQVRNRGWDRGTLQPGAEIIVEGSLARDGSPRMNARRVSWADSGLTLEAASSQGESP